MGSPAFRDRSVQLGDRSEKEKDKQLRVLLHTWELGGAGSTHSTREKAEGASLGRQNPGLAEQVAGGPAPSSATSFVGLFLRGSGSQPA